VMRVGFVGLGSQGGPMAARIIEAGFPTTLYARRPETLEPYAGTSASVAATLPELGSASDLLCVCVVNDDGVDQVLRGAGGALAHMSPGSIVAVHSTVRPETLLRLQHDFPELLFVDAPVSGGGSRAASGELLVMTGGPDDAVERCRAVFSTYARPIVHLGPLGAAQQAKLLNNALFTAQLGLVADVFEAASRQGLDPAGLAAVLAEGSGRSYALDVLAGAGYQLAAMAPIAGPLLAKDVGILAEVVAPAGQLVIETAGRALVGMGIDRDISVPDKSEG
jgi:3-hydroxyisobutyrate dehydrogenase